MNDINKKYFNNGFSEEIWNQNYRRGSELTVEDTWRRVASAVASVESSDDLKEKYTAEFYNILKDFQFIPGGRILANAGIASINTSLINCFVSDKPDYDVDSLDSILEILKCQAVTLKSEGGWGINFSFIRPRGSYIRGIGVRTPGAVKYMELFDKSSEIITEGPGNYDIQFKDFHPDEKVKIRKGAMMMILGIWHPDVIEFIKAKQTANKLTKANLSVYASDAFMDLISKIEDLKNNNADPDEINKLDKWDLIFPDTSYDKYKSEWDGDIDAWKSKGYPVNVYKTVKATYLWDLIMKSTYNRAEPGVLFLDRANETYCANYLGKEVRIEASNPCVAEGTLVNTPYGYKKVETLKVGDLISTLHPNGYEPINDIEVNKDCDLFEIKFSDGGTQKVTAAHQYFVQRQGSRSKFVEKIRVDSLKPGDYVMVEPIKLFDTSFNQLDFDKGLIMGILLGDGCYSNLDKYAIKIASNQDDVEYNNEVKSLFNKYGYTFRKDDPSKKSKSLSLFLTTESSNKLTLDFNLSKSLSINKYIPEDYINNYSKALGILNGLLATDGNINLSSNHPQFRIVTSSENMALSLRRLCLNLGMHAQISIDNTLNRGGYINGREIKANYPKYTINIASSHLKTACAICYNNINPSKRKRIHEVLYTSKLTGSSNCARILSITPCGKGTVYDLHCIESDSWITEGYVQRGCGEQMLYKAGACNLGSINLTKFVDLNREDLFDFDKFKTVIRSGVRFLDNVIEIANMPLDCYNTTAQNLRRIGLGLTGIGSTLMMVGIPYASDKAVEFLSKILNVYNYEAIVASMKLAKEKGAFKKCNIIKHTENLLNVFRHLSAEQKDSIVQQMRDCGGIRNSALFSIQPTGNTGCLANNISGGVEPVFQLSYTRVVNVPVIPEFLQDKVPAFWENDFSENNYFKRKVNAGTDYLEYETADGVYQIYKDRGLCFKQPIFDFAYKFVLDNNLESKYSKDVFLTATKLSVSDHLKIFQLVSEHLDSACSKTINIPNNYPYEDFKSIYLKAYLGKAIKGVTTYREGTMNAVLLSDNVNTSDKDIKIAKTNAPKRPKELPCELHLLTINKNPYYAIVGLLNNDPYEIFVGANEEDLFDEQTKEYIGRRIIFSKSLLGKSSTLTRVSRGVYLFKCGDFQYSIVRKNENEANSIITLVSRIMSTALRHGADIKYIVDQCDKTEGSFLSAAKIFSRTLKKYIKDKSSSEELCPNCKNVLVKKEGCKTCPNCGWSACG